MEKSKVNAQIFISYAREDYVFIEKLYQYLAELGFKPWMDKKDILPGEIWLNSIKIAIEESDFFLACISENSIDKRGVIQKELRAALDAWEGMLEGDIYVIPVRLENCQVPERLNKFQWVDLFEEDGWSKLNDAILEGIKRRTEKSIPRSAPPTPTTQRYDNFPKKRVSRVLDRYRFHAAVILTVLALACAPWIYNNNFYRVPRPEISETCQVSQKPVQVAFAELTDCSPKTHILLAADWNKEFVDVSSIPQNFKASSEARDQSQDFDIVIWGACDKSNADKVELSYELIKSRKPFEIYEPPVLHAKGDIDVLSKMGKALVSYQYGNYSEAADLFGDTQVSVASIDSAFFEANSLLFDGKYENAISAFRDMVQVSGGNSAAVHNNLGVAIYNKGLSFQQPATQIQSLSEYSQAIELAASTDAIDVEVLARANRSLMSLQLGNWDDALEDCETAKAVNENSAIPYLCLANYSFVHDRYTIFNLPKALPLNIINQYLTEAEKHVDIPPSIHYFRAAWHLAFLWKQKQEAVTQYALFLTSMKERACLVTDKRNIAVANYFIDAATK